MICGASGLASVQTGLAEQVADTAVELAELVMDAFYDADVAASTDSSIAVVSTSVSLLESTSDVAKFEPLRARRCDRRRAAQSLLETPYQRGTLGLERAARIVIGRAIAATSDSLARSINRSLMRSNIAES